MTPFVINRIGKQGDLMMSLYDINQQRLIDNGGSVLIGDRLYLEIKYRTSLRILFYLIFVLFIFFCR